MYYLCPKLRIHFLNLGRREYINSSKTEKLKCLHGSLGVSSLRLRTLECSNVNSSLHMTDILQLDQCSKCQTKIFNRQEGHMPLDQWCTFHLLVYLSVSTCFWICIILIRILPQFRFKCIKLQCFKHDTRKYFEYFSLKEHLSEFHVLW